LLKKKTQRKKNPTPQKNPKKKKRNTKKNHPTTQNPDKKNKDKDTESLSPSFGGPRERTTESGKKRAGGPLPKNHTTKPQQRMKEKRAMTGQETDLRLNLHAKMIGEKPKKETFPK